MIILLLVTASAVLDTGTDVAMDAVVSVLIDQGLLLTPSTKGPYETAYREISLAELAPYIKEDRPDEDPGWREARYRLVIQIAEADPGISNLTITAVFERFGVPNTFLLIPDAWVSVPSSGILEQDLLDAVIDQLSLQTGGDR